MIILDTNVVSEPTKPRSHPAVRAWLDRQPADTFCLTAISLAELMTGVEILPQGKRRLHLEAGLHALVDRLFRSRILPFDHKAALAYGSLVARARMEGHTVQMADAQTAAIAQVHGFTLATRDQGPFRAMGLPLVNPWAH